MSNGGIADAPEHDLHDQCRRPEEDGRRERDRHGPERRPRRRARGRSSRSSPTGSATSTKAARSRPTSTPRPPIAACSSSARSTPTSRAPTPIEWPWPALKITDFKEGDGTSGPTFPHKALTGDEVAALKLGDVPGGAQGMIVKAPGGKTYSLTLRPLLPGESE